MYLSMTCHPLDPVDYEEPQVVVVSTAELGSKHKLVDASEWSSERACVAVVSEALVNQHLVKDDWVELNISQLTLVSSEKQNSDPCDTGSCLSQILTVPAQLYDRSYNK